MYLLKNKNNNNPNPTVLTKNKCSWYWHGASILLPNSTWALGYFQRQRSSDSISFPVWFEPSHKSLPCSRHLVKIPPCCPLSKAKQWKVSSGDGGECWGEVWKGASVYSAICFLCLYFCLLSVFLFFWLLLFCVCLPGCFSVSLPVFPCVFFSSCLSLCLDALSTFLLPLCTSLPQVLSVCWYVFRLYVFRYVFRQTVVLTVGLHPAFFLSVSLLLLSLHPFLSVPVCISLCPSIGLFLGFSACLLFYLCLLPMTPDPLFLFRFLFEYLSLFNCSFLVLSLSLCPFVWLRCCMASCFLVFQPLGASFFLFICFFVSVKSSSFYLCLCLFLSCQFLSIPVCLSVLWLSTQSISLSLH